MFNNLDYDRVYQEKVNYDSGELTLYVRRSNLKVFRNMGHPCHYHSDVEFLFTLSGHLSYSVNGQVCRVGEGEGIFVNSRHLHYGFSEDGTDCDYVCVLLNPMLLSVTPYVEKEYLTPMMENPAFSHQILRPQIPWQKDVLDRLKQIWSAYEAKVPGYVLELQSCFFRIWQQLYCNMPVPEQFHRDTDTKLNTLRLMVGFLQENLTEKITLEDIAGAGHVCQSSCCRIFQKFLHRSPIVFLNECRLDHACQLLRDPSLSITEVANRSGFSGASYFTEQFRRKYGCAPRQYRQMLRDEDA